MNERLKEALSPLGAPMEPGTYTGGSSTYLTWNYDLIPTQFGDDRPLFWRALVQVHVVLPLKKPAGALVKGAMAALIREGFTPPEMVNAGDEERQHFVLECECIVPASEIDEAEETKEEFE